MKSFAFLSIQSDSRCTQFCPFSSQLLPKAGGLTYGMSSPYNRLFQAMCIWITFPSPALLHRLDLTKLED